MSKARFLSNDNADFQKDSFQNVNENEILRKHYKATEHATLLIPLEEILLNGKLDLYSEVSGKGYIKAYISGDKFTIQAGGFIGLIPLNSRVLIEVTPRASVKNLTRLLSISGDMPRILDGFLRSYDASDIENPSLINGLSKALIISLENLLSKGLYKSYEEFRSNSSFPKGKLVLNKTIQKIASTGIQYQVFTSQYKQVVDNQINRFLKYTIWQLSLRYKKTQKTSEESKITSALNRLYQSFSSVKLDRSQSFLADPIIQNPDKIPSIREYYVPALVLSRVIMMGRGIEIEDMKSLDDRYKEEIKTSSYIWNLENSFENYLRITLQNYVNSSTLKIVDGSSKSSLGAKLLFDQVDQRHLGANTTASPDIVIEASEVFPPRSLVVIEVKYKSIDDIRDEINQILTYAISYRCPNVVLAHPKIGNRSSGLFQRGKIDNINLYHYVFDLSADDLTLEEEKFSTAMQELAEASAQIMSQSLVMMAHRSE